MEQRIETHKLKCYFTNDELLNLGERNAILQQELNGLEEEKKSVISTYASQMKVKKEEILITSRQLANKYEHRNVDCSIEFHTPDKGKKRVTRQDTNETWIDAMTELDWNLWNDKLVHIECDVAYCRPTDGMKTFTHRERPELTFVEHMNANDFDKLQGQLFDDEETEYNGIPQIDKDELAEVEEPDEF